MPRGKTHQQFVLVSLIDVYNKTRVKQFKSESRRHKSFKQQTILHIIVMQIEICQNRIVSYVKDDFQPSLTPCIELLVMHSFSSRRNRDVTTSAGA